MDNFAILRFSKIKTMGEVGAIQKHVLRLQDTPNANPEFTPFNAIVCGEKDAVAGVQKRVEEVRASGNRVRVDATYAMEILLTASPEYFNPRNPERDLLWVKANVKYLQDTFGIENIVQVVFHCDEKTPHLHCVMVPRTKDGRLSAREIFGGPKELTFMQTRYAECMKHLGLVRGIKGSAATHEAIKKRHGRDEREAAVSLAKRSNKSIAREFSRPSYRPQP